MSTAPSGRRRRGRLAAVVATAALAVTAGLAMPAPVQALPGPIQARGDAIIGEAGPGTIADRYIVALKDRESAAVAATAADLTRAKQARIVPIRVLDCRGSGPWDVVIAGVDWVTANATNPRWPT